MKKKGLFRVVILEGSLIFSLTCLFVASYAWYQANRNTSLSVEYVSMEKGMTATLKYFTGNYQDSEAKFTGYKNPGALKASETAASVTDYSSQFAIDHHVADSTPNPFSFTDIFPDTRFTFSVEVTSEYSSENSISLDITDFLSPLSTEMINYTTNKGISFGEAIDVYATAFIYTDNAAATTAAQSLVSYVSGESGYTDMFTYTNSTDTPPTSYKLSDITISPGEKCIFLFTIEYSNQSNTFYKYKSRSGTTSYFEKDPTNSQGGSNVYQSLTFIINKFAVRRN